jgi:hypothetical protein
MNRKIAIICNHTLVDLQQLFRVKAQLKNEGMCCNTLFLTNFFSPGAPNVSRVPSAFSKKPFYDFFMVLAPKWAVFFFLMPILQIRNRGVE